MYPFLEEEIEIAKKEYNKYLELAKYNNDEYNGWQYHINSICHLIDNKWSRLDGPAIILPNGTHSWFKNGKLHRENGPAWIFINGLSEWYYEDDLICLFDESCKNFSLIENNFKKTSEEFKNNLLKYFKED